MMIYLYTKYGKERLPSPVLGTNKQNETIKINKEILYLIYSLWYGIVYLLYYL